MPLCMIRRFRHDKWDSKVKNVQCRVSYILSRSDISTTITDYLTLSLMSIELGREDSTNKDRI